MRLSYLYPIALAVLLSACGARRSTTLAFSEGDPGPTLPYLAESAQKRGYQQKLNEGHYVKFKYDEETWVHYKYNDGKQRVVMVVVVDEKKVGPENVEARFNAAEKVGQEIWAEASAAAKIKIAEDRRIQAEARAKADAEAKARAAAAPKGNALGEMMKRREEKRRKHRGGFSFDSKVESKSSSNSSNRCCINGAFYSCPDMAALDKCSGAFMRCMSQCGMTNISCPDKCLKSDPPDPSSCERVSSNDGQCK